MMWEYSFRDPVWFPQKSLLKKSKIFSIWNKLKEIYCFIPPESVELLFLREANTK